MTSSEISALVLGSLGFVVALLAFVFGRIDWRFNRKQRLAETEASMKQRHAENEANIWKDYPSYAVSMDYVTFMCSQCQAAGTTLSATIFAQSPGAKAQQQQLGALGRQRVTAQPIGAVLSDAALLAERGAWIELRKHMMSIEGFWSRVIKLYSTHQLAKDFFDRGWFYKADNYRRVMEPLYIANWYRAGFDGEKPYLSGDGAARPKEYSFVEDLARKRYGSSVQESTASARDIMLRVAAGESCNQIAAEVFARSGVLQ